MICLSEKYRQKYSKRFENIVPRYPLDLVSKEESDEKNDKSFLAFGKLAKIYANFQYVTCVVLIYFQNT